MLLLEERFRAPSQAQKAVAALKWLQLQVLKGLISASLCGSL